MENSVNRQAVGISSSSSASVMVWPLRLRARRVRPGCRAFRESRCNRSRREGDLVNGGAAPEADAERRQIRRMVFWPWFISSEKIWKPRLAARKEPCSRCLRCR